MSVAFTKEDSAQTAAETQLPDRPISDLPNLVTAKGLAMLQAELEQAQSAYEAASALEDIDERRRQSAVPLRDLRYVTERLRSAQLLAAPTSSDTVAFGTTVTFTRDDGRVQTYRIVGEDEADPRMGTLSHGSPVARLLLGKAIGETVSLNGQDLEITDIA